jgi:hypothetical protein
MNKLTERFILTIHVHRFGPLNLFMNELAFWGVNDIYLEGCCLGLKNYLPLQVFRPISCPL